MKQSTFTLLFFCFLTVILITGCTGTDIQPTQSGSPQMTPVILVPGIGMILVGLGFAIYGIRYGGWKYSLWGAAFWLITVLVKFIIAIPLNPFFYKTILQAMPGLPGISIFSLYVGLMTGLTEVLITWLVLKYTRLGRVGWKQAFAFGAGFGTFEALLLGLGSLGSMITVLIMPEKIPPAMLQSLTQANNLLFVLAPISERFFTIWVHILCNVLLFYGIMNGQWRWFWLSFVYKSAIDFIAGYAQVSGRLESLTFIWIIEAIVALFGAVSWWGTTRVQHHYIDPPQESVILPPEEEVPSA
jgi:uncharacterized membrane protein YhfC